jgi:diadenosine tetraphosphatase ApaH/serine/threonine PP2A family protein phosphatase
MKLALFSDIHANLQAFDACVEHAQAWGAQRFALLGDFVGYGADPVAVLRRVRAFADAGALVVKGNHDAMAVTPPQEVQTVGDSTAAWTHAQLSPDDLAFLERLPLTLQEGPVFLVHASADQPQAWHYVYGHLAAERSLDAVAGIGDVRYVLGGHVHQQALYYRGAGPGLMAFTPVPGVALPVPRHRHWLATVGSVGQPRDGDTRAMYAMLDVDSAQLTFHRVAYDHLAAAAAIRHAGLPEFFAQRLEAGR